MRTRNSVCVCMYVHVCVCQMQIRVSASLFLKAHADTTGSTARPHARAQHLSPAPLPISLSLSRRDSPSRSDAELPGLAVSLPAVWGRATDQAGVAEKERGNALRVVLRPCENTEEEGSGTWEIRTRTSNGGQASKVDYDIQILPSRGRAEVAHTRTGKMHTW